MRYVKSLEIRVIVADGCDLQYRGAAYLQKEMVKKRSEQSRRL